MISNLKFLEKNVYEIDNLYKINSYIKNTNNELIPQNFEKVKIVEYYDELYKDFIALGKDLYLEYKNDILPIDEYIVSFPSLIKYKDKEYENDGKRIEIVEKWLKESRYVYLENLDSDTNDKKIEIYHLTDMALFSYLVLTSLNNYYLKKDSKMKTKESQIRNKIENKYREVLFNDIYFDTFTTIQNDKLDSFITLINFYMYNFEISDVRCELIENSRIIYNTSNANLKYKYVKTYRTVYGLYWFILKMQIYSMLNGYRIVNMCSCGNMILGKAERCPNCLKLYDSYRHTIKQ